jgi:hypothetical protein
VGGAALAEAVRIREAGSRLRRPKLCEVLGEIKRGFLVLGISICGMECLSMKIGLAEEDPFGGKKMGRAFSPLILE